MFSFRAGIRFVFRNKKNILIIFILYVFSSAILYFIFKLIMSAAEDFLGMIFVFTVFQIFILIRYFFKIIIIKSEFELIRIPYSGSG